MMEQLRHGDKEFVSMTESLDTSTAMGRFVMDIIQRIAQLESEQIGERVYDGMRQKAKQGNGLLGSPAPFGYIYNNGDLKAVNEELNIVKSIFSQYIAEKNLTYITDWLNKNGYKTKRDKKWHRMTVYRILSNPLYCGIVEWEEIIFKANSL